MRELLLSDEYAEQKAVNRFATTLHTGSPRVAE